MHGKFTINRFSYFVGDYVGISMTKTKGTKPGGVKLMLQIFAVMAAAVVVFKIGVFFLKKIQIESEHQRQQSELKETVSDLGFSYYDQGTFYQSPHGDFELRFHLDLYGLDSLTTDTLVFHGIAAEHPEHRAGIVVMKIVEDKNLSLAENWQKFQDKTLQLDGRLTIDGAVDLLGDNEATFSARSTNRKCCVRVIRKYNTEFLYVINVGSIDSAWPLYEKALTTTLNSFAFR